MQSFRADLDEEDFVPELDEEWLNPEALKQRRNVPVPALDEASVVPAQQRVDPQESTSFQDHQLPQDPPISTHDSAATTEPALDALNDEAIGIDEIESDA